MKDFCLFKHFFCVIYLIIIFSFFSLQAEGPPVQIEPVDLSLKSSSLRSSRSKYMHIQFLPPFTSVETCADISYEI